MVGPYIPSNEKCPILGTTGKKCDAKTIKEYDDRLSIIDIKWDMDKPVGGIKIINNIETNLQGITVRIEDETINKILEWLSNPCTNSKKMNISSNDGTGNNQMDGSSSSKSLIDDDDQPDINSDDESSIGDLINPEETAGALQEQFALFTKKNVDLNEMVKRSSDYIIVDDLLLNSFKLCVSYKGKGTRRLIDVSDFLFTFPRLVVKNQILQLVDFLRVIRRVLVRVLLNHTVKFLSTKIKKRRSTDMKLEPGKTLKQLTEYKSYTTVHDLQKE